MRVYAQVAFTELPRDPKKLTSTWDCFSKGGTPLGTVKWWAHWRRYCFFPLSEMLFDAGCMWDIADFIATATADQKEDQKRRRGKA